MARPRGPMIWATALLYLLSLMTSAAGKDLGSPGNRPAIIPRYPITNGTTNISGTANSVNGTGTFDTTPPGASCPLIGTKVPTTDAVAGASSNATLHKRASRPDMVDLSILGHKNMCFQDELEPEVPQSPFQSANYDQLAKNGWVSTDVGVIVDKKQLSSDENLPLEEMSEPWPKGISMAKEAQVFRTFWTQEKESEGLPKKYNPTLASYQTSMDIQDGIIISAWEKLWEPHRSVVANADEWKGGDPAPLMHWSDVVYLEWSKQLASYEQGLGSSSAHPASRPTVNYIVISHVAVWEDGYGQDIMDAVFATVLSRKTKSKGPPRFSNMLTFPRAREGQVGRGPFNALMGTHAGLMVTKFLSEHKNELGLRRVTTIGVFAVGTKRARWDPARSRPSLIFKIGPRFFEPDTTDPPSAPEMSSGSGGSDGNERESSELPDEPSEEEEDLDVIGSDHDDDAVDHDHDHE